MIKALLIFWFSFFGSLALADHDSGYPDPKPDPKPDSYTCSLTVTVNIDEKFDSRRKAQERCNLINALLGDRLCRVERLSRNKYRAYVDREWKIEHTSEYSWDDARWLVLDDYSELAMDIGFQPQLPHSLTYSQCGESP